MRYAHNNNTRQTNSINVAVYKMYYFKILTWMKGKYKGATEMPLNLSMWFDVRIFSLLCLD